MIVWMVKANKSTEKYPEYYRIIYDDGSLKGQFYESVTKGWVVNTPINKVITMNDLHWLFIKDDILVVKLGDET